MCLCEVRGSNESDTCERDDGRAMEDMGGARAGLLALRAVTFRYTEASTDGATPTQYGLIAEEVAAIYPDVVVYDDAGLPETVQYRKVNAMLLNEVQQIGRAHV